MSHVGDREIRTQERVIAHFRNRLGYSYLGNWQDRERNCNVERRLLRAFLSGRGYAPALIDKAIAKLEKAAGPGRRTLYDANRDVYALLRYGAKVSPGVGEHTETVRLIVWDDPSANDFAIAEEVTVVGRNTKRPDLVLYVNGIAVGVIELKRSTVSVAEGIRQNLANQNEHFIRPFFTTVQLLMAGTETEGLRYGVIGTPEKHWLRWTEAGSAQSCTPSPSPLLQDLGYLCAPERLLELIHDFIVFDQGIKKVCRHNQYFGVKEAQARVRRREGGIIWHTQGSGKSLTMVWLATWIRANLSGGRVLVITDRTELDEQIESVFKGVDEDIHRTRSGADLADALRDPTVSLICSLVHKFGSSERGDVERYVEDLHSQVGSGPVPRAMTIFVDECHRTQSGALHRAMKEILPEATLIGFTGTPLLKFDKSSSIEIFGPYIHTYKYDEAIRDEVVLDLRYEARDIDQHLTSEARIDQWFEAKTRGLSDLAQAQLRQRWGTIRRVTSSGQRIGKIAADILMDMATRDRLQSGRGNAMIVSGSVHAACRFFQAFDETDLKGKCAIVTSYRPAAGDIAGEETGEGATEKLFKYRVYRRMLADHFGEPEDSAMHKVEQFEQEVKRRFVNEPGQMKLLIVVDKLLTGFDAPPATYLYIDKKMQDHGLFQAICRVNRLDGDDKQYGCVIDYKDLFRSLEGAILDYTGEALGGYDREDVEGLLADRLERGRERLEEAQEAVRALCEPVEPPHDTAAYLRYFCHDGTGDESETLRQLSTNERKRLTLYRLVAAFLRAYTDLANEMIEAGFSEAQWHAIRAEVGYYENVRREVKLASGDYVDLKMFEPAMRHLLDSYIRADDSRELSRFDDMSLVDLLVERGPSATDGLPNGIRGSKRAVAETIENNVRRLIVDEMAVNPRYYERMSKLLEELIQRRRKEAIEYEKYLQEVVALARRVKSGGDTASYPEAINTSALRAIYDNLIELTPPPSNAPLSGGAGVEAGRGGGEPHDEYGSDVTQRRRESFALAIDRAVRQAKRADWRDHPIKEKQVRRAIHEALGPFSSHSGRIFDIVKAQSDY